MQEQTMQQQNTVQPNIPVVKPKLKSTFDLIGESFKIFKSRWKLFALIQIIPAALILIISVIGFLAESMSANGEVSLPVSAVLGIFGIFTAVFYVWSMCALMLLVVNYQEDGKSWKDYFGDGIKIFCGVLGVWILVGLATLGGFILFIIPGFIFAVWFGFSVWAYVEAGKGSGVVNAMRESKRVVKGYFWPIVWRNLIFGLVIGIGAIIVYAILGVLAVVVGTGFTAEPEAIDFLIDVFSLPIQIVLTPISLLFAYLLYRNVKGLKG